MQHLTIETILDYVHGGLDAAEDANTFGHLQSCEDCRNLRDRELRIGEALRGFASASERELPESLRISILETTRAKRDPFSLFGKRLLVAVPALGGAAALAFSIMLTLSRGSAVSTPVLQATALLDTHLSATMEMPLADRAVAPTFDSSSGVADTSDDSGSPAH